MGLWPVGGLRLETSASRFEVIGRRLEAEDGIMIRLQFW
jgi:hypothetical protein